MEPRIKEKIEKLVIMGGSIGIGNITPAAEFNFYTDPQAAYVVFTSGVPIVMIGLDTTRKTQTSEKWLAEIEALGSPVSQAVIDMLSYYHRPDAFLEVGVSGGVLHDPNIIAYLIKPELYKVREAYVEIDISSTVLAGRSTVDWHGKLGRKPTATVVNEVDVEALPADFPEKIEVDLSKLETIDSVVTIADLVVDRTKVEIKNDPEQVVVKVEEPKVEEVEVVPEETTEVVVAPAMNQKTEEEKAADDAKKAEEKKKEKE